MLKINTVVSNIDWIRFEYIEIETILKFHVDMFVANTQGFKINNFETLPSVIAQ